MSASEVHELLLRHDGDGLHDPKNSYAPLWGSSEGFNYYESMAEVEALRIRFEELFGAPFRIDPMQDSAAFAQLMTWGPNGSEDDKPRVLGDPVVAYDFSSLGRLVCRRQPRGNAGVDDRIPVADSMVTDLGYTVLCFDQVSGKYDGQYQFRGLDWYTRYFNYT